MKTFVLTLTIFLSMAPVLLNGEEVEELTREAIKANKKVIVSVNMKLSDAEMEKFLPVYDQYQEALNTLIEKKVELIKDYAAHHKSMSDEKAQDLLTRYLAINEEKLELKKSFVEKFEKVLTPKQMMRYYQVENKLEAIVNFKLARDIPLVR